MIKIFLLFILTTLLALTVVANATPELTCVCASGPSSREELEEFSTIFTGKVVSMSPGEATFDVSMVWKGPNAKTIVVSRDAGGTNCGFGLGKNEDYLIYAFLREEKLFIHACSSIPLAYAQADVEFLQELGAENASTDTPTKPNNQISPPIITTPQKAEYKSSFNITAALLAERIVDYVDDIELQDDLYVIEARNNVSIILFIPTEMKLGLLVNATTGEVVDMQKPWWDFLVVKDFSFHYKSPEDTRSLAEKIRHRRLFRHLG